MWGATKSEYNIPTLINISIHAPVWGATARHCAVCGPIGSHAVPIFHFFCYRLSITGPHFSRERPRVLMCDGGSRTILCFSCSARWCVVSIHAPALGATKATALLRKAKQFQSTHPYWVRQCIPAPLVVLSVLTSSDFPLRVIRSR